MSPTRCPTSLALACALLSAACVTTRSLTVSPGTMGMANVAGQADPNNSCSPPAPAAPQPAARWSAEPPSNRLLVPVGFEIWRNTADGGACTEHREIAYRGVFQYSLATVAPVKETVTVAKITFFSKILPSGVTPAASNLCSPASGGLGSLFEVTAPTQMFSNLQVLSSTLGPNNTVVPAAFPAATRLVAFPMPWLPGAIGANTTSSPTGLGGAAFTVDVTARVKAALASNQPVIQFMLSSSDEAFPRSIPPPTSIDCRTLYEIRDLEITYVGN
jgi:hypothetical protein